MNNRLIENILKLSNVPLVSSVRIRYLINYFKDSDEIFKSSKNELLKINSISEKIANNILNFDYTYIQKQIDEQFKLIEKYNVQVITFWDSEYPEQLRNITYPPVLLFARGDTSLLKKKSIAIVGTRNPSKYGIDSAKYFSSNLSKSDLVILSGMAYGIDSISHQIALDEKGKTIAVLGSGVDVIYPKENQKLAERIISEGLLVSEFPMKTQPAIQNFPARNRIIVGISIAVILIESDINGGGIITAKFALNENRQLFAVPGNINSKKSKGTNLLIKNSEAKLIQNVDDVLCELNLKNENNTSIERNYDNLNEKELKIINLLSQDILHVDKISDECNLNPSDTLINLLNLELNGLIRKLPGNFYQIVE